MPKQFSEYAIRDIVRLQPLIHAYKTWRYRRIDQSFVRQSVSDGNGAALQKLVRNRNVLTTIAFNDQETLDLHLRLCRKFIPDCLHLVADNSSDDRAAARIRAVAASNQAAYLRLPDNPWTARGNPSRSHGASMNYVWQHVLRHGQPRSFGFLDHDLFPTQPDNPFALLESHDWYGDLRHAGHRWFLWAGYCFYRFDAVRDLPLDFGLDWFAGLDTGGANWDILYKHANLSKMPMRDIRAVAAIEGVDADRAYFEWRGSWLHEVGFAGDPGLRDEKRAALLALLQPFLG